MSDEQMLTAVSSLVIQTRQELELELWPIAETTLTFDKDIMTGVVVYHVLIKHKHNSRFFIDFQLR